MVFKTGKHNENEESSRPLLTCDAISLTAWRMTSSVILSTLLMFFVQLCAAAIKHKFIGKPLKIQIFHTKNTPVHWGKIHPINQEYSLVQRKKFIGMKTEFQTYQSHLHCIGNLNKKPKTCCGTIRNLPLPKTSAEAGACLR